MQLENIHTDDRGAIYSLNGDLSCFPEVTIFKTNKGFARGGCIHHLNDEFCCLLEGEVKYIVGESIHLLNAGDCVKIPKATPHYFISLTDSVMAEWGATVEEKKEKHQQYRQIVEEHNKCR